MVDGICFFKLNIKVKLSNQVSQPHFPSDSIMYIQLFHIIVKTLLFGIIPKRTNEAQDYQFDF